MPKLYEINIDPSRFQRKGLRPWTNINALPNKKTDDKSLKTDDKRRTNYVKTDDKSLKTDDKRRTKPLSNLEEKCIAIILLLQSQKKIKMQGKDIALTLGIHLGSLKKIISRLKEKSALTTTEKKEGRGGWVKYKINKKLIKNSPLYNSNSINTIITKKDGIKKNKFLSSFEGKIEDDVSSSKIKSNSLPEEWQRIDISPLEEEGFSKKHLIELYKAGEISPEIVQHSINHFAWGIKNNPDYYEKYKNKIFVLIGKLRKGGVWTESNYESPQEIALKELLKEKKRQQEKQEKLISDLMELEFPEWEKGLTLQQKKEINPYHSTFDRIASSAALKHYFKKEILMPRLREEGVIKQGNYKKTKV